MNDSTLWAIFAGLGCGRVLPVNVLYAVALLNCKVLVEAFGRRDYKAGSVRTCPENA